MPKADMFLVIIAFRLSFFLSSWLLLALSFSAHLKNTGVEDMVQGELGLSAVMSPEIVEIVEEKSGGSLGKDVYVAVGKNDLCILRWALEHAVSPGSCIYLVHVFPPITRIPSPVGKLSKIQVSAEQWRAHVNQEHNRRRNILHNYIGLCNDFQVAVDTVLIESSLTAKAILELIPVLNITKLVMGATRSTPRRRLKKGLRKSEFLRKHAPDFFEIMIIRDGNNIVNKQNIGPDSSSLVLKIRSTVTQREGGRRPERNFFECTCFSGRLSES